ncbi:hypothetical protein Tco_1098690, partial [Tanacetum coccineum]
VNEARGAKDTLGILFWGVMHKRFRVNEARVMSSDSASSEVTCTSISSNGDPLAWAVDFFRLREPDSPEAAPASPDYVLGLEEPDYVADLDPEEDHKDGPVDYPADGGDGDNDDSSDDDNEEEEASKEEEAEEEEEEHLDPADSLVAPVIDHVPSSEETEPFETNESAPIPRSPQTIVPFSQTRLRRARKTVRLEPPMSPSMEARTAEYIPSPPLPTPPSSLHLSPHVPISLPLPSSPLPASLFIPPLVDRREDTPEAELPPHKRLCLTALTSRYEVGESSNVAPRPAGGHGIDYGFIGTLDAETRRQRAREGDRARCGEGAGHSGRLCCDRQTQIFQSVETLIDDRQYHYKTIQLLDQEALVSREAWAHFMRFSSVGHLVTALGEIRALQARDQARADAPKGTGSIT